MGVAGLLPQLKSIQEVVSLQRYAGKTLAIDGYSWLHKAVITCTKDLFYNKPTDAYVAYFMRKIDMLRYHQITPYFVFDGDDFGSKKSTETERQESRRQYRQKALEADKRGDAALAFKYYLPAIDVTPQMAKTVIDYLETENIKFVVAPYEADSQLVFLEKLGLVHGVLSEDSDLLVFGCKTLITKLDKSGSAVEIRRENFIDNPRSPIGRVNDLQLRCLALISGCDYTNGIKGVGPVTAIKKIKNISSLDRLIISLELDGYRISPKLVEEMKKADLSFRFQRVFNPITKSMETLNEIPENCNTELLHSAIGDLFTLDIHKDIARGLLDPTTKKKLYSREYMLANNMIFENEEVAIQHPISSSSFLNIRKEALANLTTNPTMNSLKVASIKSLSIKTPAKNKACLKRISPKYSLDRIDDFFGSGKSVTSGGRKRGSTEPDITPLKRINNQLPTPLSSAEDLSGEKIFPRTDLKITSQVNLSPTSRRLKRLLTSSQTKPISSKFFTQQMAKTDTVEDSESFDSYADLSIATGSEADLDQLVGSDYQVDSNKGNILDELNENTLNNIDLLNEYNEETKKRTVVSDAFKFDLTSSDLELSDIDSDVYEGDEKLSQEAEKISRFKREFIQKFKFEDKKILASTATSTTRIDKTDDKRSIKRKPLNPVHPNFMARDQISNSLITTLKINDATTRRKGGLIGAKSTRNNDSTIKISSLSETFMYKGQASE